MRYFILAFLTLFIQTSGVSQQATVSGKIDGRMLDAMGEGDLTVDCYFPYFGTIHNREVATKIPVDSVTGTFTWEMQLEEPTFISLGAMGQTVSAYLETGWKTTIILKTDRYGKLTADFEGDGKTENDAVRDAMAKQQFRIIQRYFHEHLDSMPLPELISGYRELLVQNSGSIDTLYQNGQVSQRFHELGRKSIEAHNLFMGTARLAALSEMTKDTVRIERIKAVMKEAAGWYDLRDSDWLKVPVWPVFFTAYAILWDIPNNDPSVKQAYAPWKFHDRQVFLPEPARESSMYAFLATEIHRKFGDFDFDGAYSFFREHYPDSRYTAIVEDLLKKEAMKKQWVVRYEGKPQPSVDSSRSLVFEFSNSVDTLQVRELVINDFAQLMDAIQNGSPRYIDFWATWCFPCKQEFPHSVARHAELKKAGVRPVYVSIDDPAIHSAWIRSITEYRLEGTHVLISKSLYRKLQEEIGLRTIPRYLFVDDKGDIIDADATRPSDIQGIRSAIHQFVTISP
jgi:Thiol-disulfide isomerase and thioredoxins